MIAAVVVRRLGGFGLWSWAPIAAAVGFYGIVVARSGFRVEERRYFSLFDDAMVSMRYARNLAEGHGLVWNSGETVEGYSNFLWTLWMAVLHLTPVSEANTSLLVMLSGVATLVGTLLLVRAITALLAPGARWPVFAAVALTAFYYPLAFWTLRGMEVGLVTLFVYASVLFALRLQRSVDWRDLILLGGALAGAVLTRDDALLPSLVVLGYLVLTVEPTHRLRAVGVAGGALFAALAGHELFRLLYYGDLLPNPYYLKLGGIAIGTRLERGMAALTKSGLAQLYGPVILSALALLLRRDPIRGGSRLLALIFLSQCVYSVYVGGDAWELSGFTNRFLTLGIPALMILSVLGLHALTTATPARLRALLLPGVVVFAAVIIGNAAMAFSTPLSRWVAAVLSEPVGVESWAGAGLASGFAFACLIAIYALARPPTSRAAPAAAVLTVMAALFVATTGRPLASWAERNVWNFAFDQTMVRYGLLLAETTSPDASIAVIWAGAPPYFFGDRHAVDLFGRSDRAIAREPPRTRFVPGHMKWDFGYSLGRYRPDVLAQSLMFGPRNRRAIQRHGYRIVPGSPGVVSVVGGGAYTRTGSAKVDVRELARRIQGLCLLSFVFCRPEKRNLKTHADGVVP